MRRKRAPQRSPAAAAGFWAAALCLTALWLVAAGYYLYSRSVPEERIREVPLLTYRQELRVEYEADVRLGYTYLHSPLKQAELPVWQAQADPLVHRRAVLYEVLDALYFTVPWRVEFDRAVSGRALFRPDATLIVPRLWHQRVELSPPRAVSGAGRVLAGEEVFRLDIKDLRREMHNALTGAGISPGSAEVQLRLELEWEADGASDSLLYEFTVHIVGLSQVEIEEKRPVSVSRTLHRSEPEAVRISTPWGALPAADARRLSANLVAGLLFPAGAAWILVESRGRFRRGALRPRRIRGAVFAADVSLPPVVTLVRVETLTEMLRLHAATDKPIVQTRGSTYLVDGSTCYLYAFEPARGQTPADAEAAAAVQNGTPP
jgi:hypothetical protein